MYELSDKVSRPVPPVSIEESGVPVGANSLYKIPPTDSSVRNIEMCVSIMVQRVSVVCTQLRDNFCARYGVPLTITGATWCDKVLTLTRQLQELISWTCPTNQARIVPCLLPSMQYPQPSENGDSSRTATAEYKNAPTLADAYVAKFSDQRFGDVVQDLGAKGAFMCDILRHMTGTPVHERLPPGFLPTLQMNLQKIVYHSGVSGGSADCAVILCGGTELELLDVKGKIKLDYAVLPEPYQTNFYDQPTDVQNAVVDELCAQNEVREGLEAAVELDQVCEIAWKHLKACARDFQMQAQAFVLRMTSPAGGGGGGGESLGHNGYNNKQAAQQPYSHGRPHQQHQQHQQHQYQHNTGSVQHSQNPHVHLYVPPPELILQVAQDAESIRHSIDTLVDALYHTRMDRAQNAPILAQISAGLEQVQDIADGPERERGVFARKFCKTLDRALKDNRYLYVRTISNKARFTHINFECPVGPYFNVSCNVIACNPIPVQMTRLLSSYELADCTGKVQQLLQTVKTFTAMHGINDPAAGFLSPTAWNVLVIHVLLRLKLVPYVHYTGMYSYPLPLSTTASNNNNNSSSRNTEEEEGEGASASTASTDADECRQRLERLSLLVLLDLFFRYYVEQFDLFTSVITLRERKTTLPKIQWPKVPVLWRMCIEVGLRGCRYISFFMCKCLILQGVFFFVCRFFLSGPNYHILMFLLR
jgi:hypothetical protein